MFPRVQTFSVVNDECVRRLSILQIYFAIKKEVQSLSNPFFFPSFIEEKKLNSLKSTNFIDVDLLFLVNHRFDRVLPMTKEFWRSERTGNLIG